MDPERPDDFYPPEPPEVIVPPVLFEDESHHDRAPEPFPWLGAVAVTLLAVILACFIYVFYIAFVPVVVMELRTTPMPIVSRYHDATYPVIIPGDQLTYVLDYCQSVGAPATVLRELWSLDEKVVLPIALTGSTIPNGCDTIRVIEPIPPYIPPGLYVLRITRSYRAGAYINRPVTFETQPFRVRGPND